MHMNMKTSNGKKLWLKASINSEYTHTEINKQLVKEEWIKRKPINRLFKVFNANRTKNGEVTIFVPLELEINKYTKKINVAVTDLNSMDMFLEYN